MRWSALPATGLALLTRPDPPDLTTSVTLVRSERPPRRMFSTAGDISIPRIWIYFIPNWNKPVRVRMHCTAPQVGRPVRDHVAISRNRAFEALNRFTRNRPTSDELWSLVCDLAFRSGKVSSYDDRAVVLRAGGHIADHRMKSGSAASGYPQSSLSHPAARHSPASRLRAFK
jgi:hypothetical protein